MSDDLRDQIRRTLLVDARPDTAGVDGTADAIMALLKAREDRAMSDDLRKKIAETIQVTYLKAEGRLVPNAIMPGPNTPRLAADAIMALIAPALRDARVTALREAIGACTPHADDDGMDRQAKQECADAIAALIEKETAPDA